MGLADWKYGREYCCVGAKKSTQHEISYSHITPLIIENNVLHPHLGFLHGVVAVSSPLLGVNPVWILEKSVCLWNLYVVYIVMWAI